MSESGHGHLRMALNERLGAIQAQTLSLWMGHDSPFVQ